MTAPPVPDPVSADATPRAPRRQAGRVLARVRPLWDAISRTPGGWTAVVCWAAVIWALVLLVRAHLVFMAPSVSLSMDEAYITAFAQRMVDGQMLPYVDGVSHRGPMLYWVAALFALVGGDGWPSMRVLAMAASVACSLFTFLAGRRAGHPLAGAIGCWATPLTILVMMPIPGDGIGFNGEPLVNVFLMAGLFALAQGLVRPQGAPSDRWVAAAGALFMLGALTKQSVAGNILAPALWVIAAALSRPGLSRRARWRLVGAFAIGTAAPALLVVLRYLWAGELWALWYYGIEYNLKVYMAPYADFDQGRLWRDWFNANKLEAVLAAAAVVGGLARTALVVRSERSFWRGLDRAGFLLTVTLGAALSFLGAKAVLRDWTHYFLQAIPWFGLLAGLVVGPPRALRDRRAIPIYACLLLLPLAVRTEIGWAPLARHNRASTLAFRPPAVCNLVQQHSQPGQRMLVWGFTAQLYFHCDRKPATRYVYTTIPSGLVPWFHAAPKSLDDERAAPGSRETLVRDLEETQAALVLDHWLNDRPIRRYELFAAYLDQHYYFVGASDGFRVYKRGKKDRQVLFDFEAGSLSDWTLEGDAFATPPTGAPVPGQAPVSGQHGAAYLDSFVPGRGDAPTGLAISPPFAIDRDRFGVLVGGGVGCRVELRIDGGPVLAHAQGPASIEHLFDVNWDVRGHRGKSARVVLIDDSGGPWGHCLVDRVELYDTAR